jgi:glycosyltransferase XagB
MDIPRDAAAAPVDALLAHGLIDEDTFYRALARATQLPFLARPIAGDGAEFPASIAAGLIPLDVTHAPLRFAHAPRELQVAKLLSDPSIQESLAITTPTALRDAVIAANARSIAAKAADELPDCAPTLSFRDAASPPQRLAFVVAGALFCLFLAMDALTTLALTASLLGFLFIALANIRIAACGVRAPIRPPTAIVRRADMDLPVYTLVVPLYREASVARALCRSLMQLDYPLARLDIKLMTEEDDTETLAALRALDLPGAFEIIVSPDGKPRTKPRALNVALPLARGEFLVVYDAEDAPQTDQLRHAVETFAKQPPHICCLQARLSIDNTGDGFLPKCFAIEYAALFDVINPGLARLGLPIPLGGTSNHFRVDALRSLRGWDAWNVTEDADLGVRLARAGLQVVDLPSTTFEEAPMHYRSWSAQRARWVKGFMQTAITHSRNPRRTMRELGATAFVGAVALTLGTVLAAMLYPLFVAIAILVIVTAAMKGAGFDIQLVLPGATLALRDHWLALTVAAIGLVTFVAGMISMIVPAALGIWRRGWFSLLPWLLLMPAYYLLISFAAWRGLYDLIVDPSHWNKTEHGLSRRRRQP